MLRRITPLDIVQLRFFVNINQDVFLERFKQSRALDFSRLKNHVAVCQNDGFAELSAMFQCVERVRKQPVGERVINQKRRNGEQMRVVRLFDSVTLERAEIIGVTEFGAQLLKNSPVKIAAFDSDFLFQKAAQIF